MQKAYVYDFDKTIYNSDSTIDFFFFCLKKRIKLIKYLPIILYYFVLHFFKIVSTKQFKEKFFSFLKELDNVDEMVELFWNKNNNKICDFFIKDLESSNRPIIYIVSASPEFLLKGYTKNLKNVKLLATNMDKRTGKIKGENCKGEEKLNFLPKNIIIEKFYSDSYSDRFIAEKSKKSYIVSNGKILDWDKKIFKIKKIKKYLIMLLFVIIIIFLILNIL